MCQNCLITSSFHVFVVALFIMKHLKTILKQVEQINSISTSECTNRCQAMCEVEGAKAFFKNRRACPLPLDWPCRTLVLMPKTSFFPPYSRRLILTQFSNPPAQGRSECAEYPSPAIHHLDPKSKQHLSKHTTTPLVANLQCQNNFIFFSGVCDGWGRLEASVCAMKSNCKTNEKKLIPDFKKCILLSWWRCCFYTGHFPQDRIS